jgi:hypothetical protein
MKTSFLVTEILVQYANKKCEASGEAAPLEPSAAGAGNPRAAALTRTAVVDPIPRPTTT